MEEVRVKALIAILNLVHQVVEVNLERINQQNHVLLENGVVLHLECVMDTVANEKEKNMKRNRIIISVLLTAIVGVMLLDFFLIYKNKSKVSEVQKESEVLVDRYELKNTCTKVGDKIEVMNNVNVNGELKDNIEVYLYQYESKIEINYDKEKKVYDILNREQRTFQNEDYFEYAKQGYIEEKASFEIIKEKPLTLLIPIVLEKNENDIDNYIEELKTLGYSCTES